MNKWWFVAIFLVVLYLLGLIFSAIVFDNESSFGDKIVIFPLEGPISSSAGGDLFSDTGVASGDVVRRIKDLDKDDSVKAVIFEINSPGGTVVASQEIADAIKSMNKTNYALIREVGASGAYWVASASDKIFVSPMSITGSIGVYGSYLEFSELFDKYGVNYQRMVSGKYKDLGSPYRNLTDEERVLLQNKLNTIHGFFISEVAKNRNMSLEEVSKVATGEFFLGTEAKELGLVDDFGNRDSVIEIIKKDLKLEDVEIVENRQKFSLLDKLLGNLAYDFGMGVGTSFAKFNLDNNLEIKA